MLHPNQYQVNEAWVSFKLNDAPVITNADGDFNVFALMDAASCFILGTGFVPSCSKEFSQKDALQFLEKWYAHKRQYPKKIIIPEKQVANVLSEEEKRFGISVIRVPEEQLQLLIGDACESFQERLGQGRVQ